MENIDETLQEVPMETKPVPQSSSSYCDMTFFFCSLVLSLFIFNNIGPPFIERQSISPFSTFTTNTSTFTISGLSEHNFYLNLSFAFESDVPGFSQDSVNGNSTLIYWNGKEKKTSEFYPFPSIFNNQSNSFQFPIIKIQNFTYIELVIGFHYSPLLSHIKATWKTYSNKYISLYQFIKDIYFAATLIALLLKKESWRVRIWLFTALLYEVPFITNQLYSYVTLSLFIALFNVVVIQCSTILNILITIALLIVQMRQYSIWTPTFTSFQLIVLLALCVIWFYKTTRSIPIYNGDRAIIESKSSFIALVSFLIFGYLIDRNQTTFCTTLGAVTLMGLPLIIQSYVNEEGGGYKVIENGSQLE